MPRAAGIHERVARREGCGLVDWSRPFLLSALIRDTASGPERAYRTYRTPEFVSNVEALYRKGDITHQSTNGSEALWAHLSQRILDFRTPQSRTSSRRPDPGLVTCRSSSRPSVSNET